MGGVDPELYNTYFYVEDISGEDNTFQLQYNYIFHATNYYSINLEYSYDSINWTDVKIPSIEGEITELTIPKNSRLYLRGINNRLGGWNIHCLKNYEIGGNLGTLTHKYCFKELEPKKDKTFSVLFTEHYHTLHTLIYAHNLYIPFNSAKYYDYYQGFLYCYNLLTTPRIYPFKYWESWSFNNIFNGCTKIQTAPEIMCEDLTLCGRSTFFHGNSSLNYIKVHWKKMNLSALQVIDNNKLYNWIYGSKSSTGTFLLPMDAEWNPEDYRGACGADNGVIIPENWEIKYFNPETDEIVE